MPQSKSNLKISFLQQQKSPFGGYQPTTTARWSHCLGPGQTSSPPDFFLQFGSFFEENSGLDP
jgi:hypothetical protein